MLPSGYVMFEFGNRRSAGFISWLPPGRDGSPLNADDDEARRGPPPPPPQGPSPRLGKRRTASGVREGRLAQMMARSHSSTVHM